MGDKKNLFIGSLIGVGLAFGIESLYRHALLSRSVYKIIAEPLFHVSVALVVIMIVLSPLRGEIFKSWLRLAILWVPLQILVVVSMAIRERGTVGGGFFNAPTVESMSIFFSCVFFFVSLVFIFVKYSTLRNKMQ